VIMKHLSLCLAAALFAMYIKCCTNEPVIDTGKLESAYIVLCHLESPDSEMVAFFPEHTLETFVYIQRLKYIFTLASEGQFEGSPVEGADARIVSGGDTIVFHDDGLGYYRYKCRAIDSPFKAGEKYRLLVRFPDGREAVGETTIPDIKPEDKDTLYVFPDSVVKWSDIYPKFPEVVVYNGKCDSVRFDTIGNGKPNVSMMFLESQDSLEVAGYIKDNYVCVHLLSGHPSELVKQGKPILVEVYYEIVSPLEEYYRMFFTDDFWPIEEIEEISNIRGAYGIFCSSPVYYRKTYIVIPVKRSGI